MEEVLKAKESSISVAVRIRPLTSEESKYVVEDNIDEADSYLSDPCNDMYTENKENLNACDGFDLKRINTNQNSIVRHPFAIKKILNVVDDRMLIFDPQQFPTTDEVSERLGSRRRSLGGLRIGNHNKRHKEHKFIFDRLFDEHSTQQDVYESTARPSVESVLEGFNSTIFAYGATGCGKTFTITGTPDQPGIVFLALKELFMKIDNQLERDVTVEVSYLEIYNETIKDLLNIQTHPRKLTLLENENREIIVSNLTKVETTSVEEVMDIIIQGNYNRTVSSTEANLTSSRSHAVLQVYVTQNPKVSDIYEKNTKAVLSIIDLAGSERASATKNKGARLTEGANINKSLLALGNCINALCDSRKLTHVPYRDSKLTRLLKFSLGGNCKTLMIVCVSPSSKHYDETLNALKFANRAKEIKTKVMRNRTTVMKHVGSYMKVISDQKRRIHELETLMDTTVQREINKYVEQRKAVFTQTEVMIERLNKNIDRCNHLKDQKVQIVAKRKLMLLYIKQINVFYKSLLKFDNDERLTQLKDKLNEILLRLKDYVIELESSYNERTELDSILLETSESFLKKLRELESWTTVDERIYNREIEYLKSHIERQVFYESSILFDTWITDEEFSGYLDFIPNILSQFMCVLEDVANNIQTVEQARMKYYGLSDDLVNSCIKCLNKTVMFDNLNTTKGNKKRKNSGGVHVSNDADVEPSLIRQGNRLSSINNKLMRINLNATKGSNIHETNFISKDNMNDSLSEMESSLILDQAKRSDDNESTPQNHNLLEDFYESPTLNQEREVDVEETIDANSSVIIRKDFSVKCESPLQNRKLRGKTLTSRKLNASPKINSPHRLVGLDASSNNFQIQMRDSFGKVFTDSNQEGTEINQIGIDCDSN
ncbi:hypothetical protein CANINC_002330 [Pichia inconspicua]|uniref:Kinesin motor domain-containing protein n=1 Tax=Pichia inconspicua TaxID=52247 RepID=A0A4V4NFR8_9ASCO|nr:hypothetical protein CANINC_002330 [[Candida] inconspicua]